MRLHFISCWYTIFSLHISDLNYVEEVKGYAVSKYGTAILVDQRDFTYSVDRKKGNRIFWRCSFYKRKCKARASTYKNYIMNLGGIHNHEASMIEKMQKCEKDSN